MPNPRSTSVQAAYPSLAMALLAIVAVALTLRGPIVAITPVLGQVAADLGLGAGAAGLLGTLPVLAFAVCSPPAAVVIRKVGPEVAVVLTLTGIFVSQLVRAIPTPTTVFAGTMALGVAITLGNIVVPVLIHRDVAPPRVAMVTGLYAAVLNVGSLATVLVTAPLANALGWPWALASWSALAAAAGVICVLVQRRPATPAHPRASRTESTHPDGPTAAPAEVRASPSRPALRIRATWLLSLAFTVQAFSYFGFTTWLPTYLSDATGSAPAAAGALAASFQAWGIAGGFLVPALIRTIGLRGAALSVGLMWTSLSVGTLGAPGLIGMWLVLGGMAQSGGFIVIFSAVAVAARDSREAAGMSAIVQACGYVVATLSGPVIGALRELSGGWQLPMTTLIGATVLFTLLATMATTHVHRAADYPA